jgi:CubicO group peptidase (beta-lactamase class C family)
MARSLRSAGRIEVEHLMRMTTGLDLDETNSGFDPSSQMLYMPDDMAGFAVRAKLIAPVGKRWHYSSGTTQILVRRVRDGTGERERASPLSGANCSIRSACVT